MIELFVVLKWSYLKKKKLSNVYVGYAQATNGIQHCYYKTALCVCMCETVSLVTSELSVWFMERVGERQRQGTSVGIDMIQRTTRSRQCVAAPSVTHNSRRSFRWDLYAVVASAKVFHAHNVFYKQNIFQVYRLSIKIVLPTHVDTHYFNDEIRIF